LPVEFGLQSNGGYEAVLDAARWAEANGLVSFGIADHYLLSLSPEAAGAPAYDPYPHLAGLARETERIALGVYVSPITFRHPAVLVKMAVGIDHMSGGRFSLGVGTGWLDLEHEVFGIPYPDRAVRFEMMEDALAYIRAALAPGAVGHDGRYYSLQPVDVAPRPLGDLPLIVGGVGDSKTPRLAGLYADEYNLYPGTEEQVRTRIARARDAAASVGRDPDTIEFTSAGAVLTAPTEGEYRELFERTARDAGVEPEQLEAHFEYRSTPRGSHEQVAETLSMLSKLGVTRFHLQRGAGFDREAEAALVDYLRREVG
jgi:alkanesulfonate monooxygenase SsuD/methylene tetrahydromethanopterin reductase-like flavin-dependent oxidoreductase (luciferase family)